MFPCLGSALNEARVMTAVLKSSLPNDTTHWMKTERHQRFCMSSWSRHSDVHSSGWSHFSNGDMTLSLGFGPNMLT